MLEERRLVDVAARAEAEATHEAELRRREEVDFELVAAHRNLEEARTQIRALETTLRVACNVPLLRDAELGAHAEAVRSHAGAAEEHKASAAALRSRVDGLEQLRAEDFALRALLEKSDGALAKSAASVKYLTAKLKIAENRVKTLTARCVLLIYSFVCSILC